MGIILIIILVLLLIGALPTRGSLYLAFSGWSADWHSNLLLLKDYHFSGKGNEGISITVGDWTYLR